ncbi:LamG domain-containing protein [Streptomyces mayteni]
MNLNSGRRAALSGTMVVAMAIGSLAGASLPAAANESESRLSGPSADDNQPPPQILTSQLSLDAGRACAPAASPVDVNTARQVYAADVIDPNGDRVAVEFRAYWDSGDGQGNIVRWAPGLTTFKSSGSEFSMSLPSGLPREGLVQWEARSYDGVEYSPWSSSGGQDRCHFVYNTSVPSAPAVSSSEYPESDPADPLDSDYDGVGRSGFFTFSSSDPDVNRYRYRFASGSQVTASQDVATTGGEARTVRLVPEERGPNVLYVRALDTAGNASSKRAYIFRVGAGTPARAVWGLDEEAGATETWSEGGPWQARLEGDVTVGGEGARGNGLHLAGTGGGYARVLGSTVDPSDGFTVSFWARLPEAGVTTTSTAVSQTGDSVSAFDLTVDPGTGGWSLGLSESDAADSEVTRLRQNSAASLGEWTHVAGVVNASEGEALLYVDGRRVGSATFDGSWGTRGNTVLGARLAGRTLDQYFAGDLDEVQFHDYGLSDSQVASLAEHQSVVSGGRPATAIWSFEESAGATSVTGRAQRVAATVNSGVTLGAEGEFGDSARFDGVTGAVASGQPIVDAAQSFAVSAWVNLPRDKANRDMVVAAQTADDGSGFALVHVADGQGWTMRRWSGGGGTVVQASQSPCVASAPDCVAAGLGTWTHVVGVHDVDAQEIRVFVNGELAGSAPFTEALSSNGAFTIGAADRSGDGLSDHLAGRIDNVRVFDRVATAHEVELLSARTQEVAGRWQFESAESGTTPDASENGNPLTLGGDAGIGTGWVDFNALVLDGLDDYATTDGVPVDTSDSFTVTAWAQAATAPSGGMTLVSAPGANNSAFAVRFEPDPENEGRGQWQVVLPDEDAPGATEVRVSHTQFLDVRDWNHVALVYDAPRREARLYVNGLIQDWTCPDPPTEFCGPVSWADEVITHQATGSLEVGRARVGGAWAEHWGGSIDDLWLFRGALSDEQIRRLAISLYGMPTEVP